jgi:hypothetical protein
VDRDDYKEVIVFKEDFKFKYVEKLTHKILQELNEKLPDKGYFAEMIVQANEIVGNITKEG